MAPLRFKPSGTAIVTPPKPVAKKSPLSPKALTKFFIGEPAKEESFAGAPGERNVVFAAARAALIIGGPLVAIQIIGTATYSLGKPTMGQAWDSIANVTMYLPTVAYHNITNPSTTVAVTLGGSYVLVKLYAIIKRIREQRDEIETTFLPATKREIARIGMTQGIIYSVSKNRELNEDDVLPESEIVDIIRRNGGDINTATPELNATAQQRVDEVKRKLCDATIPGLKAKIKPVMDRLRELGRDAEADAIRNANASIGTTDFRQAQEVVNLINEADILEYPVNLEQIGIEAVDEGYTKELRTKQEQRRAYENELDSSPVSPLTKTGRANILTVIKKALIGFAIIGAPTAIDSIPVAAQAGSIGDLAWPVWLLGIAAGIKAARVFVIEPVIEWVKKLVAERKAKQESATP